MTGLQKYKKNKKNKEKTSKHRRYIFSSLKKNRLGYPQRLFHPIVRRQRASEQVEVVRQAVQPHERRGIDAVALIGPQRRPFGPAAEGRADLYLHS